MKYIVTLKDKTYEVEVEEGEAMVLDEYEAKAPAAAAPAAAAPAAAFTAMVGQSERQKPRRKLLLWSW